MKVLLAQFERVFHAFKGDASRDAKTQKPKDFKDSPFHRHLLTYLLLKITKQHQTTPIFRQPFSGHQRLPLFRR